MITEQQGKRVCRGRRKSDRELEVQFELMRIIAEQNREITFEYDAEFDRAALYEVVNGTFTEKRVFEKYTEFLDDYMAEFEPEDAKTFKKAFLKCLKKPSHFVLDLRMKFGKKKREWHRLFLASVDDLEGNITTVAGRFVSIHSEKIANENIKHRAEIDALTGIYNHITFENICDEKLRNCKDNLLFMMLDVDDFKIVNDSLGHNVGDLVLNQTGNVLNNMLGENGYAGRLGGDEFAVMVWGFESVDEMKAFCVELRAALKRIIFDMEYSASMGVAFLNGRNITFKDIYYEADQAVYTAKRRGKNQIVYYDDTLMQDEFELESVYISPNSTRDVIVDENSRDRVAIDSQNEYVFIVDSDYNRLVQINRAGREIVNMPEEQWINMSCENMFGEHSGICENCDKKKEQYFVSRACNRKNSKLSLLLGEKDFFVHIIPGVWHGYNMKQIFLIDIDNSKQITAAFRKKDMFTNAIQNALDYILENKDDYDYKHIISFMCEFYNADCGFIIYGNHGKFDKADILTKPNAKVMGSVVEHSIKNSGIQKYWELLDENGSVFLKKIDKLKESKPEIYKALVDARIWTVIGQRIGRVDAPDGALVLLNPRQNEEEDRFYKFISAFFSDELARKEALEDLEYAEAFDRLTGVYSRASFGKLDESWEAYDVSSLGIFAVDIIGLKYINREFGYDNGNKKLCELADCISTIFSGYRVYRYEDDQIAVFCKDVDEDGFQKLVKWAKETIEELDFPVAIGYSWSTNVNVNRQMREVNELIINDKNEKVQQNSGKPLDNKIVNDVRKLLDNESFLVYLQPKVNIHTDETVGAEALIRLKDHDKGIVGPIHFINLFEKYNIVHEVDLFVLKEVCKFQKNKIENGENVIPISVNFSKKTLAYEALIDEVREIMGEFELPTGTIQIEITETVGDMDHILIKEVANSLRMMGFVLAMDDFGTKYSNIEMLVKFQFGIAKIDRSLIKNITDNDKNIIVLRHLTDMIKELGIECVVEGAETEEQINILKTMSCDVVQGFYYGKPIYMEEFYENFMG